jgi:hypothetical protein
MIIYEKDKIMEQFDWINMQTIQEYAALYGLKVIGAIAILIIGRIAAKIWHASRVPHSNAVNWMNAGVLHWEHHLCSLTCLCCDRIIK